MLNFGVCKTIDVEQVRLQSSQELLVGSRTDTEYREAARNLIVIPCEVLIWVKWCFLNFVNHSVLVKPVIREQRIRRGQGMCSGKIPNSLPSMAKSCLIAVLQYLVLALMQKDLSLQVDAFVSAMSTFSCFFSGTIFISKSCLELCSSFLWALHVASSSSRSVLKTGQINNHEACA